jgi:protoheme IX farnesyltransferase
MLNKVVSLLLNHLFNLPRNMKHANIKTYLELTKPRILFLALLTTILGYFLASRDGFNWLGLFHTVLGSALVGGGANTLNQYLERELDRAMNRTKTRPLPSQRLDPRAALLFGLIQSITGVAYLMTFLNPLTGWVGVGILVSYLLIYTPLKTKTVWCTLVGAIPGALPPIMGWTAAANHVPHQAWVIFAILFMWQLPHFFSLAWFYKEDYARAGFLMLPVVDKTGSKTAATIVFSSLCLFFLSLLPSLVNVCGKIYLSSALIVGVLLLGYSLVLAKKRTPQIAKRFFLSSNGYLLILMICLAIDKI